MKVLIHGTKVMLNGSEVTIRTSIKDFSTGLISYRIEETGELVKSEEVSEIADNAKKVKFAEALLEIEKPLIEEEEEEEESPKSKFSRTKK